MAMADRYDVRAPMGEGGFSRVFRAAEKETGRPVALKVLKSAFHQNAEVRQRFEREVFAVASLSNAHIVGMYDFDLNSDQLYIAMEYVEGKTLRERMHEDLTIEQRFAILSQIADAVGAAHGRNVVHRDLKPENIKVVSHASGTLEVKVLDFGMAKLTQLESQLELEPLTRAGTCFGTPQYMSPEQIRGKLDDKSIDLYALSIIAYELLTGRRPWDGLEPYEVMRAVLRRRAPRLTQLRYAYDEAPLSNDRMVALNVFFERALSKQMEPRPKDARTLIVELEHALFGETGAPEAVSAVATPAPRLDDTVPYETAVATGRVPAMTEPMAAHVEPEPGKPFREPSIEISMDLYPVTAPVVAPTGIYDALAAGRRGASFRSFMLPLLVLIALGGSLGYLLAGSASAQSSEVHDFIVGNR